MRQNIEIFAINVLVVTMATRSEKNNETQSNKILHPIHPLGTFAAHTHTQRHQKFIAYHSGKIVFQPKPLRGHSFIKAELDKAKRKTIRHYFRCYCYYGENVVVVIFHVFHVPFGSWVKAKWMSVLHAMSGEYNLFWHFVKRLTFVADIVRLVYRSYIQCMDEQWTISRRRWEAHRGEFAMLIC